MLSSLVIPEHSYLHIHSPGTGLCWEPKLQVFEP